MIEDVRMVLLVLAAACSGSETGQHEITSPGELLNGDGTLREPGWAPRQILRWDASRVADADRLRQWDFFTLMDDAVAVNLTLVDLGFLRAGTIGVVDLASGEKTDTIVLAAGEDGFVLSPALEGAAAFTRAEGTLMAFETGPSSTAIRIAVDSPMLGPPVRGSLVVRRRPAMPYLSLATPFAGEPHQFFFEQKVPGMSAEGTITVGERIYALAGASAIMDWGRGEWPAQVTWRWAGASGVVGGETLAFNLGEGFGSAEAGTENLVVLGDVPYKLGAVAWTYDANDPLREWSFRSDDGRVSLVLAPVAPEVGGIDLGSRYQRVTKAYGRFRGRLVLGGRTVDVDGLPGFAEHVDIAW